MAQDAKPDQLAPSALADLEAQVRTGLQSLIVTIKNCALYPENSPIRQDSLTSTYRWLFGFLEEQESLKLFVDFNSLIFQGQIVHQDRPGEQNIVFPLFRDGIQWIEFLEGLELKEMLGFIDLLNRFRLVKEDDDDDLVTAMWGADFQNVKYKTANEFWDIDPLTDITALKVVSTPGQTAGLGGGGEIQTTEPATIRSLFQLLDEKGLGGGQIGRTLSPEDIKFSESLSTGGGDQPLKKLEPSLWRLSEKEKRELQQLVAQSNLRSTHDGLEPVLGLLKNIRSQSDQDWVMDFLAESVRYALAWGEFEVPGGVRAHLKAIAETYPDSFGQLVRRFELRLGRPESMEGLALFNSRSIGLSQTSKAQLKTFLGMLPKEALGVLVKIYHKIPDRAIREEILASLAMQARFSGAELAPLINTSFQVQTIIHLIDLVPLPYEEMSRQFLAGLSRHVAPPVREKAARAILEENPEYISLINHLLAEPDPAVSRFVYSLLGQKRDPAVEKTLLNFLKNSYELSQPRSDDTILNGYRALGRCAATTRAAEFARHVLLKKDFRAFLGLGSDLIHRQGAALALFLMPPGTGREEILKQAAHSLYRDIKRAYQAAETSADFNGG
ncbi:MAG: hypothetical protein LBP22_08100 [Deltaproteobacteria bacterium]|jgi:hypothetical protein|nr:hypothetical protein [Deltaproteobacteria bacterium]